MRRYLLPGPMCASVALLLCSLAAVGAQLDSATYFGLDRGMSESELLVRAGTPDLVTHPGGAVISNQASVGVVDDREDPRLRLIGLSRSTRFVEIKEYHYIPDHTESDPHLTVVTLRGGRIFEIERTKLLTRPKAPPAAPASTAAVRQPRSDADLRIERLDRVLNAAQAYAATRARLKNDANAAARPDFESASAADGMASDVYQGTGADGVRYYGDSPIAD